MTCVYKVVAGRKAKIAAFTTKAQADKFVSAVVRDQKRLRARARREPHLKKFLLKHAYRVVRSCRA